VVGCSVYSVKFLGCDFYPVVNLVGLMVLLILDPCVGGNHIKASPIPTVLA
jgi:hypothetical protein